MLGCGKQAYEGTIDDDNMPAPSFDDGRRREPERQDHEQHRPSALPPSGGDQGERNRLTSKQLAALWALARKLDIDGVAFRNRVRERFNVTVEFLSRNDASTIIGELSAKLGNGHDRGPENGVAA